jgi:probable F420-dependent oxidoreductase
MEVGASVPHIGPLAEPELVVDYCRAADAAGFDGLWTADHIVVPAFNESYYTLRAKPAPFPFEQLRETMGLNLELNTTLAVAAAVTRRVKLCSGVAVLPIRNPVLNARQLASIDQFSGGRVLYGVGVGWLKEEADALGMPWDRRGARTDEQIALFRALWCADGEVVEFDGEFYRLPPMDPRPFPVQRPIPIVIGGHSDPAIDRAARIGDGWIAAGMGADRFREAFGRLKAACDRHGRDVGDLQIVNGEHPDVLLDPAGPDMPSQVERAVEGLRAYEAMGVTHMKVSIRTTDPNALLEMVDVYGREVLPAYRGG